MEADLARDCGTLSLLNPSRTFDVLFGPYVHPQNLIVSGDTLGLRKTSH